MSVDLRRIPPGSVTVDPGEFWVAAEFHRAAGLPEWWIAEYQRLWNERADREARADRRREREREERRARESQEQRRARQRRQQLQEERRAALWAPAPEPARFDYIDVIHLVLTLVVALVVLALFGFPAMVGIGTFWFLAGAAAARSERQGTGRRRGGAR